MNNRNDDYNNSGSSSSISCSSSATKRMKSSWYQQQLHMDDNDVENQSLVFPGDSVNANLFSSSFSSIAASPAMYASIGHFADTSSIHPSQVSNITSKFKNDIQHDDNDGIENIFTEAENENALSVLVQQSSGTMRVGGITFENEVLLSNGKCEQFSCKKCNETLKLKECPTSKCPLKMHREKNDIEYLTDNCHVKGDKCFCKFLNYDKYFDVIGSCEDCKTDYHICPIDMCIELVNLSAVIKGTSKSKITQFNDHLRKHNNLKLRNKVKKALIFAVSPATTLESFSQISSSPAAMINNQDRIGSPKCEKFDLNKSGNITPTPVPSSPSSSVLAPAKMYLLGGGEKMIPALKIMIENEIKNLSTNGQTDPSPISSILHIENAILEPDPDKDKIIANVARLKHAIEKKYPNIDVSRQYNDLLELYDEKNQIMDGIKCLEAIRGMFEEADPARIATLAVEADDSSISSSLSLSSNQSPMIDGWNADGMSHDIQKGSLIFFLYYDIEILYNKLIKSGDDFMANKIPVRFVDGQGKDQIKELEVMDVQIIIPLDEKIESMLISEKIISKKESKLDKEINLRWYYSSDEIEEDDNSNSSENLLAPQANDELIGDSNQKWFAVSDNDDAVVIKVMKAINDIPELKRRICFDLGRFVRNVVARFKEEADINGSNIPFLFAGGRTQVDMTIVNQIVLMIGYLIGFSTVIVTTNTKKNDITALCIKFSKMLHQIPEFDGLSSSIASGSAKDYKAKLRVNGALVISSTTTQCENVAKALMEISKEKNGIRYFMIVDECDELWKSNSRDMESGRQFEDLIFSKPKQSRSSMSSASSTRSLKPAVVLNASATLMSTLLLASEDLKGIKFSNSEDIHELIGTSDYVGVEMQVPLKLNGIDQFLQPKEISKKSKYWSPLVEEFYKDALKPENKMVLILDVCNLSDEKEENICDRAEMILKKFPDQNMVILCASNSTIDIYENGAKQCMESPKDISNFAEYIQKYDNNPNDPVIIILSSQMTRSISYQSEGRVPTHLLNFIPSEKSTEDLIHSRGVATGNFKEKLAKYGRSHITLLTTEQDYKLPSEYIKAIDEIKNKTINQKMNDLKIFLSVINGQRGVGSKILNGEGRLVEKMRNNHHTSDGDDKEES